MGEGPPEFPEPASGSELELPVTSRNGPSAAPASSPDRAVRIVVGLAAIPLMAVGTVGGVVAFLVETWIEEGGINSVGPYQPPSGPAYEAELDRWASIEGVLLLSWFAAAAVLVVLVKLAPRTSSTATKLAVCLAAWGLPVLWVAGAVLIVRPMW